MFSKRLVWWTDDSVKNSEVTILRDGENYFLECDERVPAELAAEINWKIYNANGNMDIKSFHGSLGEIEWELSRDV